MSYTIVSRLYLFLLLMMGSVSGLNAQRSAKDLELTQDDTHFGEFRVITTQRMPNARLFKRLGIKDSLEVLPKGYLILMHKSGATIEINKAGTYSVLALQKRLYRYAGGYPKAPMNLEIKNQENISYRYHQYFRYWPFRCPEPNLGILLPLNNRYILDRNIEIKWYDKKWVEGRRYALIVWGKEGKGLKGKLTSKKSLRLTLPDQTEEEKPYYRITLEVKKPNKKRYSPYRDSPGCSSTMATFMFIREGQIKPLYEEFKTANRQNHQLPLIRGMQEVVFWYNKGFGIKAKQVYEQLLAAFPRNVMLKAAHKHFLVYGRYK